MKNSHEEIHASFRLAGILNLKFKEYIIIENLDHQSARFKITFRIRKAVGFLCIHWFFTLMFIPSASSGEKSSITVGTIITNTLNVRAKPGRQYEVVNRLHQGDQVKIILEKGDWLGILAPSQTEAWVPLNKLEHEQMVKDQISVYSGPGTIFSSYHTLSAGEIVRISKVIDNKWGKIEPPEDAIVWIHKSYVDYVSKSETLKQSESSKLEARDRKEKKISITEKEMSSRDLVSNEASKEFEKIKIHPIAPLQPSTGEITFIGESIEVVKSGTIIPLDHKNYPFKYALAKKINLTLFPMAYVATNQKIDLEKWEGRVVSLSGKQAWMKGWPRPRIEVISIKFFDESERFKDQ